MTDQTTDQPQEKTAIQLALEAAQGEQQPQGQTTETVVITTSDTGSLESVLGTPSVDTETTLATADQTAQAPEATETAPQPPVVDSTAPAVAVEGTKDTTAAVVAVVAKQAAVIQPSAVVAPIVEQTPQLSAQTPFQTQIETLKISGTASQKSLIATFEQYIVDMMPGKPVDPEAGAAHQYRLWRKLHNVAHEAPIEEFKSLWSIILGYFHEHAAGVFHERYIFRFSESWRKAPAELTAMQRTINLIKVSADPKTRATAMKQVDLDLTLSEAFNDEGRKRILSFYRR